MGNVVTEGMMIRMQLSRPSHENHHWPLDQQAPHSTCYLVEPGNTYILKLGHLDN